VEQCPQCKGRRLRATREERDHAVGGVLYTGFVNVHVCKTCRAVLKDKGEEEAFVRDVERVAAKGALEGTPPRKIHKRP
jgi:Zn-finger nucleic acid-binding protein